MKKRMIAWLLCVCMTFTATPEMLFADVTAESQQTQEESSQSEKDPAETQTTEQENESGQESEKSDETKKVETETAEKTEIAETESTEKEKTSETESSEEEETTETEPTEETETVEKTETGVPEETESPEETIKRTLSGNEISRIAWVQELVTLFDLTVEEDNYPDNYYSDISEDDSFYRDVMVACEYGMIDLEAGEEFRPEDAVTREFAAQTMNEMLGFVPETDSYTYQDATDVTYKEAAQIAVDRGWVTVSDGKFLPEQPLTTEEHDAMIADAKQVLADAQIETGKENTCTFASGVVIVAEGTAVSIDVDGTVMIENCPVTITPGTTFAVYVNDIAMAYKAESVRTEGTTTYIATSDAEDGAVLNVDQQGELDVDLREFVPADEETYVVNNVAVTESRTRGISYNGNTLRADKTISISDDVTATVNVVISNMKVNYRLKNNDYYFTISGDMEYSCNVKGDAFQDINHTLTLGVVPLGGIGMLTLAMEYNLSGEATLTVEKEFESGFAYSDGFRVVGNSRKKGFSFSAEADLTTGVVLSAQATLGIVSGDINAKAGARMNLKYVKYSSGTPSYCVSQAAYLYASVGASAKIGVGILSKRFSKSIEIWGKDNSPVRVYYHIEDGVLRTSCTRGKEFIAQGGWTSYCTSPSSRYFNPAGVGSYVDAGAGDAIVPIYTYTLDDANRATITGYSGSATALYIPGEIDGHEVVAIGRGAFKNRTDLKTVMIPDSVENIGIDTFSNCIQLENISWSKNLKKIGENAFYNCDNLQIVKIPKSLKDVYATYDSIDIPNGVFNGCSNLKTVNFEEGSTIIADALFRGCDGLEEVTIPDTITEIYGYVFADCKNLKNINISDSVTVIGESVFEGDTSIKEINLPDSITKLGARVFSGCNGLESIVIPDSVINIGIGTFSECKNLKSVTLSRGLEKIGENAFYNCDSLQSIEIPKSLEDVYATYDSIDIPNGVFNGCSNLKTVNFEEESTVIADALFRGCDGLEEVTIPKTVTIIKNHAFNNCANLKRVDISNGVTEIEKSVFEDCTNLQKVILPDTVNSMGTNIFYNCINLTEVHLPNIRQNIMANTFYNCKKLTTINFPSTLTTIGNSAFMDCESLPEAVLPSGVEKIESNAFKNCKALKKVVVPDTVSTIGSSAFYGCEALTDITLGGKLKKIESQTFYGCTTLPSIVIPYNVTTIGDSAFVNCTKLTQITVPRNTTSIASNAFSYPKKMTMYGPSDCYAQTYANGKGIKYVAQDIPATSIRLDVTNKTAEYYEEFQLTATVTPQNFTDAVVWTSSNEDVATVSDTGYVEICGVGTAVIIVTAGKVKATCTVTVPRLINWIEFDEDEIELKAGETYQLKPDISPSTATNKTLKYTSSDSKVAKVSDSGLVTAISEGEARIRAQATDGSDEYAICYVTVTGKAKVAGITLNQTSAEVKRGENLALQANISPYYAANKNVVWKSVDTKVATVDDNGNVTAKAPGRTKITATSAENSSYQASCTITVPYNITYNLNKGKNNAANPSTYYGKKITLKDPSRKGYVFAGWYTDSKFKKKIAVIDTSAKCDYTLYAKWTKVKVAKVFITSAKNSKSKQILLKYKKVSSVKGYQISYSMDKKFKKAVTKKNTAKTSYTIKKLKKGKTYYVRIRAYKLDSTGGKVYGKYSSVKKVKISK